MRMHHYTVIKKRNCHMIMAARPGYSCLSPTEKVELAVASKQLHVYPLAAQHLHTSAICDAYVAGES